MWKRLWVTGALVLSLIGLTTACGEAFGGPTILSLEIEPRQISVNHNSGMTDQFFDVTIQVSGFESQIDKESIELFIVENSRSAPRNQERMTEITDSTIVVRNIQQTWFNGMEPGTYHIGATVGDIHGTSDTRRDLATVELTE